MDLPSSPDASPEWWDARYEAGDIPWDTGIVPPEVVGLVESLPARTGWALDLGCGTGLNTRYLAARGFVAVGVDLAQSALAVGRQRARLANLPAHFFCADVSDLSFLRFRAALALDVGCFHTLPNELRPEYIGSLAQHLLPGAPFLLYAHDGGETDQNGPIGADVRAIAGFATHFDLLWTAHGRDRERDAAWCLMRRR